MENFNLLGSLAFRLHQEFVNLFYLFLPVFFALAILIDWFKTPTGSADFLNTLKRAVIATLLVAAFPEISDTILAITIGISDRISDMSGLDSVMQMASEKAKTYTLSPTSLLLGYNDLTMAILTFGSYILLYIAKFLSVALYHFMWSFLSISAPLLILFSLFKGTAHITINLFKSMVEVACYRIVWSILSAMLTALAFGNAYAADGNYLTIVVLNFIIAIAIIATPLIVRSLVGGGLADAAQTLGTAATVMMASVPAKAAMSFNAGREVLSNTAGYAGHMKERIYGPKPFVPDRDWGPDLKPDFKDPLMPKTYTYPELPKDFKEPPRKWFGK